MERFSIVSFVWGPGQKTPIHDHTVWGLIGMLRGAEISFRYEHGSPMEQRGSDRLEPGMIDVVSPAVGDIHQVTNAFEDRPSISIHVYGANIGAVNRHVFDPQTGESKSFVSGYSNNRLPNPWRGVNL
jgi:predicted metal-dependent enzyme (double-stranded beta helix superfamily)